MQPKPKTVLPPLWAVVLLLISIGLGRYLPILEVVSPPFSRFGFLSIGLGTALNFWAFVLFCNHRTTIKPYKEPSTLMTTGIFGITRNPIYLGVVLILLGVSIRVGAVTSFISPLVFFLVCDRRFIPLEEGIMERVFGKAYIEYKEKVRRWI